MADVFDWDTTAAGNDDAIPDGAPEGWAPSSVNAVVRENMADLATLWQTFPWLELSRAASSVVRVGDIVFRCEDIDQEAIYTPKRRLKIVGDTTLYCQVNFSVFGAGPHTIVFCTMDAALDVLPTGTLVPHVSIVTDDAGLAIDADLASTAKIEHYESANLVKDPSFETTLIASLDTIAGNGTWSIGTTPRGGAKSLDFDSDSQTATAYCYLNSVSRALLEGHSPVREGERYLISAFARWSDQDPVGANKVSIGISWRNENGAEISESASTPADPASAYAEIVFATAAAPATAVYGVPFVKIATGSPSGPPATVYHFDDLSMRFLTERATPSVESAATVTLPEGADFVKVTGTTDITSITASWAGRVVQLHFADVLTFTNGSNLKIAGDLVTAADAMIEIVCDGTDWYEIGRSSAAMFLNEFVSVDTTVTAAGTLLSFTHGLPVAPKLIRLQMVCINPSAGWATGDQVECSTHEVTSTVNFGRTVYVDSGDTTTIKIRIGLSGEFVGHKTTGTATAVTESDWAYRVSAWT